MKAASERRGVATLRHWRRSGSSAATSAGGSRRLDFGLPAATWWQV